MPSPTPTRDRLIDSARHLFWERGYAGTSMADLLAHANVNSGSFYHFFDSKEALLREVLTGYLHALHPVIVDPALASTADPVERIFAILSGYRGRILSTNCQYGCPLAAPSPHRRAARPRNLRPHHYGRRRHALPLRRLRRTLRRRRPPAPHPLQTPAHSKAPQARTQANPLEPLLL